MDRSKTLNEIYLKHRNWLLSDLKQICIDAGKENPDVQILAVFIVNHLAHHMALMSTQNGRGPETSHQKDPDSDSNPLPSES